MKTKRRKLSRSTGLDVPGLRELVGDDGKMHFQMGVVWKEGASHYELVEENGVVVDVLVDVRLEPSGIPVTARLGGVGGGPGLGLWGIPGIGTHVTVGMPRGNLEAGVVIVACASSERIPDGLGPTTYVICVPAGGQLLVHDGTAGEAVPLALKSDVDALADTINQVKVAHDTHIHVLAIAAASGSGGTGTAAPPVITAPSAPPMQGTQVTRSK